MGKLTAHRKTKDGMEILYHMFIKGDPEMERMLEEETLNAEIARRIYDLRTKAGLTQKELARKIGTTASVISRLEDSDYEGHSLAMLKRIATALDYRVEVRLVPCKRNGAEGRGQTAKRNLSVASK